jgi:hypothetical protein
MQGYSQLVCAVRKSARLFDTHTSGCKQAACSALHVRNIIMVIMMMVLRGVCCNLLGLHLVLLLILEHTSVQLVALLQV